MNYEHLMQADPELYASMERELGRQRDHLELIASENFTSPAVMEAVGSHLTNKYAEGYPGARYYGGCDYVDEVERLRFAVPEIFCVKEPFVVRAEVFEKIVARADGDAGHRGVGIARDAVGDLIDRAVAAAGIEPHLFSALGKTARERGRVADRRGEHTLYVQTVLFPQRLRHRVDALAAVVLTGRRIDDKNVFQGTGPPFR